MSKCRSRSVCQVSGCTVNLLTEDRLSVRAVTCQAHRQKPVVDVNGKPCRFCQQCIRVHDVERFDGDKKGCRKRLESHNRRRRNPTAAAKSVSLLTESTAAGSGGKQEKRQRTQGTFATATSVSSPSANTEGATYRLLPHVEPTVGLQSPVASAPVLGYAGDAIHSMPEWQGDLHNLSWADFSDYGQKNSSAGTSLPLSFSQGLLEAEFNLKAEFDIGFDNDTLRGTTSSLASSDCQDGIVIGELEAPQYPPREGGKGSRGLSDNEAGSDYQCSRGKMEVRRRGPLT
mmetsp:Transcript_27564/g.77951  ORF Transcript_27564/g.77951 Transcript_27564/m.77951 type:complete len:287 (+) Transcript_27564:166-1026(+)